MHPRDLFTWARIWHARFQVSGAILLIAGFSTTIWLGASASSTAPPDVAQSAVFVLTAGILNVGGVWLFSRNPKGANLTASRMALRHLGEVAIGIVDVREQTERAFEMQDAKAMRAAVGLVSVQISAMEQRLGSNLDDWVEAHPDLVPTTEPQRTGLTGETKANDD